MFISRLLFRERCFIGEESSELLKSVGDYSIVLIICEFCRLCEGFFGLGVSCNFDSMFYFFGGDRLYSLPNFF